MDNSEKAILKTIIYSDIFDYPLKLSEIWLFLFGASSLSQSVIQKYLQQMQSIEKYGSYYVLQGRKQLVSLRQGRYAASIHKMQRARSVARILFYIPTVYCIGVSGGVAMQNANEADDIDLFVITKKNTVWISRLLLLFLLQLLGVRRKRGEQYVINKVCLNMLIDESAVRFSKNREDIYTAHEVVQLVPLIDRQNTYQTFLEKNVWVKSFLPHAYMHKRSYIQQVKASFFTSLGIYVLSLPGVEFLARMLQQMLIQRHQTSETVSKNILAFHPMDYRISTIKAYRKKLEKYAV